MDDDNWQKVREIFDSALRRQPVERRRFVKKACGVDKTLLAEVESLLSSLDSADSFMETPAAAKVAGVFGAKTKKLEPGKCFGHYEIIEQIGAGGMGEVYVATDKKLDRKVAIKILNEKFSRDETNLNRFVSEAKAASALNHPNILTIYEFDETEDAHFIVSEYIEGLTLREVIGESTLKLSEILDISIQIASALSAAHKAHLVHRDIKPENIMVRPDGFVKVLDFGLAKLVEQKNKSILGLEESTVQQNKTAKGVIMGTVNYMSPEQAKGERIDERTDIFSFGATFFEMITGRTPFAVDSALETLANLINSEPLPLAHFTANVPDKLQKIVSRTLRKNVDERYQTMKDLLADIKDLRENLTFEEKLERSSAAAPKNLTGGHQFKQNESENDGNQTQISKPFNAYQAYQLARYHFQQMSPPDVIKSRALLEEAVRFDADFAPAHAALAEQSIFEVIVGLQTPAESFPKAKNALRRAAGLNPHSAEFYAAAGYVDLVCDWNFTEAERNLRKALELNSHYVFANNYLGHVFMFQRLPEEAEFYLRRTVEIEPMGLYNRNILMIAYFLRETIKRLSRKAKKCSPFIRASSLPRRCAAGLWNKRAEPQKPSPNMKKSCASRKAKLPDDGWAMPTRSSGSGQTRLIQPLASSPKAASISFRRLIWRHFTPR